MAGNTNEKRSWIDRKVWLGQEDSAVNITRFWIYLGFIGLGLCLLCLVRSIAH